MILKNSLNRSFVKGENKTFVRSEFLFIELIHFFFCRFLVTLVKRQDNKKRGSPARISCKMLRGFNNSHSRFRVCV